MYYAVVAEPKAGESEAPYLIKFGNPKCTNEKFGLSCDYENCVSNLF